MVNSEGRDKYREKKKCAFGQMMKQDKRKREIMLLAAMSIRRIQAEWW